MRMRQLIPTTLLLLALFGVALGATALRERARLPYGLTPIRVGEDLSDYLGEEIRTCASSQGGGWRGACYRELGKLLSARYTLVETVRALTKIDEEPGIRDHCHSLAHFIGTNEFNKNQDLGETIRACSAAFVCSSGCFHGAVEGLITKKAGDVSTSTIIATCRREESPNDLSYFACNHGLGHAFMVISDGAISSSLRACDLLSGATERGYCYTGVFMENVLAFGSPDHRSSIDPSDPGGLCRGLPTRFLAACYEAASSFVLRESGYDFGRVATFCSGIPLKDQKWCYAALGAGTPLYFDDPQSVKTACGYAPRGERRAYCLVGAVEFLAQNVGGDIPRVLALCRAVDASERDACYALAGETLSRWYPGGREAVCAQAGEKGSGARSACLSSPSLP